MSGFIKCPKCNCKISIHAKAEPSVNNAELGETKAPSIEDRILRKIASKGGMKIRKIIHAFQHECSAAEIREIMRSLVAANLVEMVEIFPPRGPSTIAFRRI